MVDLCSNSTSIKIAADTGFEALEPMKLYTLSHKDKLRFGSFVAEFFDSAEDVIESSQTTDCCTFASAKSKFFVPETQENEDLHEFGTPRTQFEIDETEAQSHAAHKILNLNEDSTSSGSAMNIFTERDDTSNGAKEHSQNLFSEISIRKRASLSSSDDEEIVKKILVRLESPRSAESRDGSVTPDLDFPMLSVPPVPTRNGSVTPDLDFPMLPLPPVPTLKEQSSQTDEILQMDAATQIEEKPEILKVLQADIETDVDSEDDEEPLRVNQRNIPKLFEQTQPLFGNEFRTRLQLKRQADIKPKTISLTAFDETQDTLFAPSIKKQCFAVETQPFLPKVPKKAMNGNIKVVNRLLMSSEEDSMEELEVATTSGITKQISPSPPSTPKSQGSPLIFNAETPEVVLLLPSDSQYGMYLDGLNEDKSAETSGIVLEESLSQNSQNKENISIQVLKEPSVKVKRIRRKIMKYASDSDEDAPTTSHAAKSKDKIPEKTPSKEYSFAISNLKEFVDKCEKACDQLGGKVVKRIADADILLTKEKIKVSSKFLASLCKRIPIVGVEYVEASLEAGKWLDPNDFIIKDTAMEAKRELSLKNVTVENQSAKLFDKYSVFATKCTKICTEELEDIVECAGGEFIVDFNQVPTRQNLAIIYKSKEKTETAKIVKKYPNITKILDTEFINKIFCQSL